MMPFQESDVPRILFEIVERLALSICSATRILVAVELQIAGPETG